jgi:acetyl-CoA acyltransferase
MTNAVIIDVVRTASGRGKPGGALSSIHPVDLASTVLKSVLERNGLESSLIDDVILGCVTQSGDQSVNVARNAVLAAGFDERVPATTIDRQCGSSQQAAHFAAQGVIAGACDIVIAGGVESMSRVPIGSAMHGGNPFPPSFKTRYPDGLVNQGVAAELIAAKWDLPRELLDAYSARSHQRANAAAEAGWFDSQLVPVVASTDQGDVTVTTDETVRAATTVEGLAGLNPSFYDEAIADRFPQIRWSITPGNSSPLTDGASAALIMSEEKAAELGLTPRARFHSFAVVGDDPLYMLTGPLPATRRILERSGLSIDDIAAFEVNEAFAPVPLAWQKEFGVDDARLNAWGGAIALGHALGSSGTRLLGTLLAQLEAGGGRYGLQVMCEGGGLANATVIERI